MHLLVVQKVCQLVAHCKTIRRLESKEFSRHCITLRINGVMGFVLRPESEITRKHNVSETVSVSVFR
jgi:hypothetical protein